MSSKDLPEDASNRASHTAEPYTAQPDQPVLDPPAHVATLIMDDAATDTARTTTIQDDVSPLVPTAASPPVPAVPPAAVPPGPAVAPVAAQPPAVDAYDGTSRHRPVRMRTVVLGLVLLVIAGSLLVGELTSVTVDAGAVFLALMIGGGILLIVGARRS